MTANISATTYVGFHVIRAMGPQNANRDEDGRPKSANLGGHYRLRHSSQSLKRVLRVGSVFAGLGLATRTRQAGIHLFMELEKFEKDGIPFDLAEKLYYAKCANAALGGGATPKNDKKALKDLMDIFEKIEKEQFEKGLSKAEARERAVQLNLQSAQAIFITKKEIGGLEDLAATIIELHRTKKQAEAATLADRVAREGLLGRSAAAVDIALFGRMVAEAPEYNQEAAASFSHAITTHAALTETDYLTGAEEWNHFSGQGAATMADNHFASGVFYSFVCVNFSLLVENLDGNVELARETLARLVRGIAETTPGGKRTSFAHNERAAFVEVEVGHDLPNKLDLAFVSPVNDKADLLKASITRYRETSNALRTAYSLSNNIREFCCYAPAKANQKQEREVDTLAELSQWVVSAVAG